MEASRLAAASIRNHSEVHAYGRHVRVVAKPALTLSRSEEPRAEHQQHQQRLDLPPRSHVRSYSTLIGRARAEAGGGGDGAGAGGPCGGLAGGALSCERRRPPSPRAPEGPRPAPETHRRATRGGGEGSSRCRAGRQSSGGGGGGSSSVRHLLQDRAPGLACS
uniref:Uncharacterized protein n=1 Tax=Sphaerodactylus townsendi TaxID=933632 RepID=A0ACB8GDI2_9SAUR